ncbi:MAG: helix-turn-helix transcriptional regulator [Alphaproteobacteria bacterium]|nr:helix-turn-helix transcriptional regulator [Alphaproteobacteria bacterium]
MSDKIIKNNIRKLRKVAGLTQEQLAEKIGISQVHLGRLENNARSMDLEQVESIAAALGVKPIDILPPSWQEEQITPEEREILRMIRKSTAPQSVDNNNISTPADNAKLPAQSSQPPQKSNER